MLRHWNSLHGHASKAERNGGYCEGCALTSSMALVGTDDEQNALSALPPTEKIYSPEDDVNLEDESGRIRLIGSVLKDARLVTGVIVAALGVEAQDGSFEVVDICAAGLSPQPELDEEEEGMAVDGIVVHLSIVPTLIFISEWHRG